MAFPPKKQSITITRPGDDSGGWGSTTPPTTFTVKCRVSENTEKVQNEIGEEVVSSAKILIDGLSDIRYNDVIYYEDEIGRIIERSPIRISPMRFFNGKALNTAVFV